MLKRGQVQESLDNLSGGFQADRGRVFLIEFVSHGSHLSTFKRDPSLSSLLLAMPVPAHGETPGQRASRNAQGTTTVHAARQEKGGPIHSAVGEMWNARRNHAPPMDVIPIDDGVARANGPEVTRVPTAKGGEIA